MALLDDTFLIDDIEITYGSEHPDLGTTVMVDGGGRTVHQLHNYMILIYRTAGEPEVHIPYTFFWTNELGDVFAETLLPEGEESLGCVVRRSTWLQRKWQEIKWRMGYGE